MDQLAATLRRLQREGPRERFDDLVQQTRSILRQSLRAERPIFLPGPGGPTTAFPDPVQAAALSWELRLSLWPGTRPA